MTRGGGFFNMGAGLLVAAWAFAATPAAAADPGQINCPVRNLGPGELARVTDIVRRQGDEPMPDFYASIDACRQRLGWSEAEAEQALMFNLAEIGQREARRDLEGRGVDVAAIERALLADSAVIESARGRDAGDRLTEFFGRLDPAVRSSVERHGGDGAELVGTFLIFRAVMETSRRDFSGRR
ncbi:MAG TPA: hypothetical protein VF702_02320 [Allosphingosinicella sp.]|jgi:hypothetical protein